MMCWVVTQKILLTTNIQMSISFTLSSFSSNIFTHMAAIRGSVIPGSIFWHQRFHIPHSVQHYVACRVYVYCVYPPNNIKHTCYEKLKSIMFIENCTKIVLFSCSIIREVCFLNVDWADQAAKFSKDKLLPFLYLITIYIAGTEKREKMSRR